MEMDEWVLASGALNHTGYQRHDGALMTWRRYVQADRRPLRSGRVIDRSGDISEANRRVTPSDWVASPPAGYYSWCLRPRPVVLGRGEPFGPGPVGFRV